MPKGQQAPFLGGNGTQCLGIEVGHRDATGRREEKCLSVSPPPHCHKVQPQSMSGLFTPSPSSHEASSHPEIGARLSFFFSRLRNESGIFTPATFPRLTTEACL